jgi:NhaP-type Na+/H+ or K+/H+ antiporter
MTSTETALTVLGALLVFGALVSGIARRSLLSLTAVFVLAGVVLGRAGFDVLRFDATGGFVSALAVVALVVILFRDGLEVEAEMLRTEWHLPLRKLVLAMPITAAIVAVAAAAFTDLSWTEAFLLGALLSPTDPVLTLGFAYGVVIGFVASLALPRGGALTESIPAHQKALYALGVAFVTYGATTLPPHGNGFIAVYVCAITLGIRRPDIRGYVEARADDIIEIVKLGIFVVFGALLTVHGLFGDGWAAVAIAAVTLLVARPVAVAIALTGSGVSRAALAFMAWFGPKGVATMTFSLLVLGSEVADGERIFNLAALVVFCSIVAHGLSDTPGSEWMARRSAARETVTVP